MSARSRLRSERPGRLVPAVQLDWWYGLPEQELETTPTRPADKVVFESGGDFIRETRREVAEYLADAGTRRSGTVRLLAKSALAFGLMIASWALLLALGPDPLVVVLCLGGLVLGGLLTAFCVQHDANHGATFRSRRLNHLLGWTADALLGISSYAWRVKHNVAHHTYTNIDGYDDDVRQTPFAKLTPTQTPRPWYRFQHYYVWPLYSLMGIRWQTVGDLYAFVNGRIGRSALRFPRGWDLAGLVAGKLVFVGWAFVVPLFFYPWWAVLAGWAVFTMLLSLVMATTFQLAHCVEEAVFVSPQELLGDRRVWAVHEVETTVDFCARNRVLTWALGGLNFQIEHHLFPGVPHTHYPAIAGIVRRNCDRFGIRYTTQPSLWAALRSHFLHLRRMGRLGLPAQIEMG
jgi:linoleoyl-CoA desaturase